MPQFVPGITVLTPDRRLEEYIFVLHEFVGCLHFGRDSPVIHRQSNPLQINYLDALPDVFSLYSSQELADIVSLCLNGAEDWTIANGAVRA